MKFLVIQLNIRKQSFIVWKNITKFHLGNIQLKQILSYAQIKNGFYYLYKNLCQENNRKRLLALAATFNPWVVYHLRCRKLIRKLRWISRPLLTYCIDRWKKYIKINHNIKLFFNRKDAYRLKQTFHAIKRIYHTNRRRKNGIYLRVFHKYKVHAKKQFAIIIWKELHFFHQASKKIQTIYRGYRTRKYYRKFTRRLIKLEKERNRMQSLYQNNSLLYCNAAFIRYQDNKLHLTLDKPCILSHMKKNIKLSRINFLILV